MNKEKNLGSLDRFRMVAALLIIAIHTSPLASFGSDADFFLTRILARIAVPFFFMVTGQFVISDCMYDDEKAFSGGKQSTEKLLSHIKKTAVMYGIAIIIYIPAGIYAGHYQNLTFLSALRMIIFDGTFYHLWYFPACIIGMLLVYLMSRFPGRKAMIMLAGVLYLIGLFGDSYYGLIKNVPVLSKMYEFGFQISSYTRNGFFFAPVFLILGAQISRNYYFSEKKKQIMGLMISFSLMTAEAFTLRYFKLQRHDSMYLALIPVMIFLYKLLLSLDGQPVRILRNITMWMYILHPAVIVAVRGGAKISHMTALFVDNSLVHFLTVTILSGAAACVLSSVLRPGDRGRFSYRNKDKEFLKGRAWIEINRNALRQNAAFLRAKLPEKCRLMPAVKADAYGHGAVLVAKELNRIGVEAFCVACVSEGVKLRKKRIKGEILVLGYTHPEDFYLLHRYHLTQTVIDYAYGVQLSQYGKRLKVHIGIDTGMHRLGERSENIDLICKLYHMKNLQIDGLFTHLCADDILELKEQEFTYFQAENFYKVVYELEKRGYPKPALHLQSSYSVLNYPELAEDYARVGIALYGVLSTGKDTEEWKALKPVLSLKARVAAVKDLYAGEPAGYGMDFTAAHNMKIAVITIGYGDGYPRSLSDGVGAALIKGGRAPIIGRICMDQTIVDVSEISDVKAGDTAVLIGKSGEAEISVCDVAKQAKTITNEIVSRLGARLERIVT